MEQESSKTEQDACKAVESPQARIYVLARWWGRIRGRLVKKSTSPSRPAKPYRSYRNELRRVFVIYGLTPVFLLAAVAYALLVFWGYHLIETRTAYTARRVAETLNAELAAYETGLNALVQRPDLPAVLRDALGETTGDTVVSRVALYEALYAVPAKRMVKSTFHVFGAQGQPLMSDTHTFPAYAVASPGPAHRGWGVFRRMAENPDRVVHALAHSVTPLRGASVLSMGRAVRDSGQPEETGGTANAGGNGKNVLGFILFDLLQDDLAAMLHRPEGGEVVVTDQFNNVLVSTNRDFIDQFGKLDSPFRLPDAYVERGEEAWFVAEASTAFGPFVVHGIAASRYFRDIVFNGAVFLTLVFALSIWLMLVWSRRIAVRKARAVESLAEVIEAGNPAEPDLIAPEISGEFLVILHAYNRMLEDLSELNKRHQEELRRAMRAEVKQLASQFNPHFLYNTLETVRCMIRLDPVAANAVIIKFSTLLRYSLDSRTSQVRLDDDLTHIRNYLDILKYRFGTKFDYELETDHNACGCLVPKLILQPLVENAVVHGFGDRESLRVTLCATVEANDPYAHNGAPLLVITISDNGQGVDEATLHRLRAMLREPENITNFIGLYNAHRRIVIHHGPEYGMRLQRTTGKGLCIRLEMPAVYA